MNSERTVLDHQHQKLEWVSQKEVERGARKIGKGQTQRS